MRASPTIREVIKHAVAIVLPGVGAFTDAANAMRELGQMDLVRERIAAGVPFLGICLGLHLMFARRAKSMPRAADAGPGRHPRHRAARFPRR